MRHDSYLDYCKHQHFFMLLLLLFENIDCRICVFVVLIMFYLSVIRPMESVGWLRLSIVMPGVRESLWTYISYDGTWSLWAYFLKTCLSQCDEGVCYTPRQASHRSPDVYQTDDWWLFMYFVLVDGPAMHRTMCVIRHPGSTSVIGQP